MTKRSDAEAVSKETLRDARSSAAGFCAMVFIACVAYLAFRDDNLMGLVSFRGLVLIVIGLAVAVFVFGYALLFCNLWLQHFAAARLAASQSDAPIDTESNDTERHRQAVTARVLSLAGTLLMVIQLVLIYLATGWAYRALFPL